MKNKKLNNKGISLMEAFLASFIFVISVSAIFVTLTSLRKPVVNNDQAIAAARVVSKVLEDLRSKIETRSMNNCSFAIPNSNLVVPDYCDAELRAGIVHYRTVGNYQVNWLISVIMPSQTRKIEAKVNWTDAS